MRNLIVSTKLWYTFCQRLMVVVDMKKNTFFTGEDAIITLGSLTDSKPAGAIDKKSKLNILFSVSESTKQLDPFDLYVEIKIQKAVMGLFWPVPSPIMDGIAKNIEKADKNVKYVGNK